MHDVTLQVPFKKCGLMHISVNHVDLCTGCGICTTVARLETARVSYYSKFSDKITISLFCAQIGDTYTADTGNESEDGQEIIKYHTPPC